MANRRFFLLQPDNPIYERIELLRGPGGLFQGAGEPGASLNLVRKRAPGKPLLGGAVTVGSWSLYRAELDGGAPLTDDGALRVRGVVVHETHDSFQDVVNAQKKIGYGTLEYDLAPATTLSVGGVIQRVDSVINQGLPAYADGRLIDVSRATFIGADWNELVPETNDLFAELEHRLSGGGDLKFAVRRLDRKMLYKVARANSAVDANGDTAIQTGIYTTDRENVSADLYASLPFDLGGRSHHLIVGANWRDQDQRNDSSAFANTATQNVFDPDHAVTEPTLPYIGSDDVKTTQFGGYGQLRLRVLEPLTLVAGGRISWWQSRNRNLTAGTTTADYAVDGQLTPFFAVICDLLEQVSLYASYADIFQPQNAVQASGEQIKPRTGSQYETGIKAEFLNQRVIAQFALFRLEDQNRAIADPNDSLFSVPSGKVRSQGFESEITGMLLPGWNLSAGYTHVDTEYRVGTAAQQGQAFAPFTPRHSANLWTRYRIGNGSLQGLSIGGGLRAVSSFYSQSGGVSPTRFVADAYTLLSAQLGYELNRHWSANLTVSNLLDEKYYEKVSIAARQNFYGEPRSVVLALRARF
ncbi:MAG: TonB-dependent siderophore receptor [Xanthomonadaceae bacterium]|nr:TonB-dependent siderophore receptor [Xanthomonadaceae bacterium]